MSQAEIGNDVKVHYTGRLENGTEFDSSRGREPLEFTLGEGQLIPGFEKAVIGMVLGASKTITIPAEQAYGPYYDEMVLDMPRTQFPDHINPAVGLELQLQQGDRTINVTITELSTESVKLDANHPLAGENLIFDIELVSIA